MAAGTELAASSATPTTTPQARTMRVPLIPWQTVQGGPGSLSSVETVSFTRMADGTREDYELLSRYEAEYSAKLPDRLLAALDALKQSLVGYQVTRYEHSLQSASRAHREGKSEEYVVAALLHDIGDELAPHTHSEMVGGDPAAVRLGGDLLDRRPPRRLPVLLLRRALRRRPERARAVPLEPLLRRVRRVLRALRPELLRPGVRVAAGRVLRADGEARVRRASLPAGVAPRTGRAPATRTGGRSWRPESASRRASPRSSWGCRCWRRSCSRTST